jgi:hypothetical protein
VACKVACSSPYTSVAARAVTLRELRPALPIIRRGTLTRKGRRGRVDNLEKKG